MNERSATVQADQAQACYGVAKPLTHDVVAVQQRFTASAIDRALAGAPICTAQTSANPCESGAMTPVSTNLHFHGLTVPPVCHQDDLLKTSIQPDDAPFEYRLRIPDDAAPGLYWYHPHLHGFSKTQVLGGASGALIIVAAGLRMRPRERAKRPQAPD